MLEVETDTNPSLSLSFTLILLSWYGLVINCDDIVPGMRTHSSIFQKMLVTSPEHAASV